MPKLKQPRRLNKLAVETLGRTVRQRAIEVIGSGADINTSDLHEYLYGDVPDVVSLEISAHMLSDVVRSLSDYKDCRSASLYDIILAIVFHDIRFLDLSKVPEFVGELLSCNILTYKQLHTLLFKDHLSTLPVCLNLLKFLVKFQMQYSCTNAIIQTLASSCSGTIEQIHVNYSRSVNDSSFGFLVECRKLSHIFVANTSVTAEGIVQFLQQRMKCDDTAEDFLGLGLGSEFIWHVSSTQLNEISLCCPMLEQLEIRGIAEGMEALVSLNKLETLILCLGEFDRINLNGFLRVRGSYITSLEMKHIESLDLTCILNHCVNIKRLSVISGSVMRNLGIVAKACQNLETLKFSARFSPSSIEGMLYACVNLTSLYLCTFEEHITDELILRVLSRNPLQKLTWLSLSCPELTIRSVDAITEHCPLLEELECFNCFMITAAEVKILRQKIENSNQDLKTHFRPITGM